MNKKTRTTSKTKRSYIFSNNISGRKNHKSKIGSENIRKKLISKVLKPKTLLRKNLPYGKFSFIVVWETENRLYSPNSHRRKWMSDIDIKELAEIKKNLKFTVASKWKIQPIYGRKKVKIYLEDMQTIILIMLKYKPKILKIYRVTTFDDTEPR